MDKIKMALELEAISPSLQRVVREVFSKMPAEGVQLHTQCDRPYIELGWGLGIVVVDKNLQFVLRQTILHRPESAEDVDEVIDEVEEIGQFDSWQECVTRACEIMAVCAADAALSKMEKEHRAAEFSEEMNEFFESRWMRTDGGAYGYS